MSNDPITIDQLAGEAPSGAAGAAADAATDADGDTAEWVLDLYDRLKDDGMLQAMLWGPDALPEEAGPEAATDGGGGGDVDGDVDAEVVADALEDVQNTVGDLKISQLVKLTRDNPALVDDLLEEKLAGDGGGGVDRAGDQDDAALPEGE